MKLRKGDKANYDTLLRAAINGDLALVDLRRKSDGKSVAGLCAIGVDGGEFEIIPLAIMIEGNPFELFDPPDRKGGYYSGDDRDSATIH